MLMISRLERSLGTEALEAVGSLISTFTCSLEILVVTMKKMSSRNVMSIIGASWKPISSSCFLASFIEWGSGVTPAREYNPQTRF